MSRVRSLCAVSPVKITVGYLVFGVFWIPSTDVLLATLFPSQQMPSMVSLLKGWSFILLSSLLIFSVSRLHHQQMKTTQTQLHTANQQLHVFNRILRHNLRNNLNVIRGYTGTATDRVTDPELQSQLATVHDTAGELLRMSEKLKIIEQINPAEAASPTVDLVELVTAECERLQDAHPAVTITTELPDHVWITGDDTLAYAIRETVDNAITHHDESPAACELTIELTRTAETAVLEITDNGPGIPPAELQPVRTNTETPLSHGSGIGLWIVTWTCRRHGGNVTFSAAPSGGTTARFAFDLAPRDPASESPVPFVNSLPSFSKG